jgi:predicted HAD superfamily Cof-like phosphohydrolase
MEKQIRKVLAFQKAIGAESPIKPTLIPQERAVLRLSLQTEELNEMKEAMSNNDIVEIADAVVDQMYILIGTALEYGFADRLQLMFDEVHRSNMTKFNEDGEPTFNENGKLMKPERYSKPNLKSIMDRDFEKWADIEESLTVASNNMFKEFENKINKYIAKNLTVLDKAKFEKYVELEDELAKIIDVKIDDTMGLSSAEITLYSKDKIQVWE